MIKVILTRSKIDWLTGKRVYFGPQSNANLREGRELVFDQGLRIEPYVCYTGTLELMKMGAFSYINSNPGFRGISEIGRYCSIATGLYVPRPRHPMEWLSTSTFTHQITREPVASYLGDTATTWNPRPARQRPPVKIGNDVWIGLNVLLMPGVEIGDGAVVAAGSVVTRSVGPYEVVGGNPARVLKRRFSDALCERLQASRWWRFDFRQFGGLDITDPEAFVSGFEAVSSRLLPFSPALVSLDEIVDI